jgi:hypothetical protein
VGGTHVAQLGGASKLPGPRATLFFAPAQIRKRQQDWGADVLGQKLVQAWHAFRERASAGPTPWLRVQRHTGGEAARTAFERIAAGDSDPAVGHVLSLL